MPDSIERPAGEADDLAAAEKLGDTYRRLRAELHKIIIGQDDVIEQLLVSLFAGGHCILEGVPGLAKTLMISSLARCLSLSFNRIQFTPDLMPSDITGTEVISEDKTTGTRAFKEGARFLVLAGLPELRRAMLQPQAAAPRRIVKYRADGVRVVRWKH